MKFADCLRPPKTTRFYGSLSERTHLHRAVKRFLEGLPPDARVLDLGSGLRRLAPRFVNVDLRPSPNVNVRADACALPFMDGAFDAVVAQGVFAYVRSPGLAAAEIGRILKPLGRAFVEDVGVYPFDHTAETSGTRDRWRFTPVGWRELFGDFRIVEAGPCMGPASALAMQLRWVLALGLSLGSRAAFRWTWQIAGWTVFPLKFLDPVFFDRNPLSAGAAGAHYVVVEKK